MEDRSSDMDHYNLYCHLECCEPSEVGDCSKPDAKWYPANGFGDC
jgi:hypothetical protein